MPCACPSGSLPTVGRAWALLCSHITGESVLEGEEAGHEESETAVSANPAICPRLLIALACPLFPPTVGRALMWPFRQRNGLHVRFVPKPQTSSPSGSGTDVSAKPTTSPRSLSPPWPIELFGPPSVRSILSSSMFNTAGAATTFAKNELLTGSATPSWISVQP